MYEVLHADKEILKEPLEKWVKTLNWPFMQIKSQVENNTVKNI